MLKRLRLENVGPAQTMDLTFSRGVNILTGNNGLGKSFILDVAWWALTRQWPQEVNPLIWTGRMAYPPFGETGKIHIEVSGKAKQRVEFDSEFNRKLSAWPLPKGRPTRQGLVIYAMADGSFSVWDPAQHYGSDTEKQPAFVFTHTEVWKGKENQDGSKVCNGILVDLLYWIMEKGAAYRQMKTALETLSPPKEPLTLGEIGRMSDAQRYPCVRMPYKQSGDIPVILLASAIKRVLGIAYYLVWAWQEHNLACRKTGETPTSDMTFIIDEIEAHLHPCWQQTILQMLKKTIAELTGGVNVQYIISTHSPLVMASCEDFFSENDTWIDIDLCEGNVIARPGVFTKKGDVTKWLLSEAFDLDSTRSLKSQEVLDEAFALMDEPSVDETRVQDMQAKLESVLSSRDSFWLRWNVYLAKHNNPVDND
ncbi:MAG: AAA family ATPase [Akkermansia muciniphila]|nr:AAA family ATPase [Akkermansia muciniphila]